MKGIRIYTLFGMMAYLGGDAIVIGLLKKEYIAEITVIATVIMTIIVLEIMCAISSRAIIGIEGLEIHRYSSISMFAKNINVKYSDIYSIKRGKKRFLREYAEMKLMSGEKVRIYLDEMFKDSREEFMRLAERRTRACRGFTGSQAFYAADLQARLR